MTPPAQRLKGFVRNQWRRGLNIPSELAVRLMNRPGTGARLDAADAALPALAGRDASIVAALREDGVCVTSLDALGIPETAPMWRSLQQLARELAQRSAAVPWRHFMSATAADLLARPEVLRWALEDRLLDIVEAYLGGAAAYDGPSCFHSVANGLESGARVWHRDREDLRMIKIAIYATDVTVEGGPFEILHPRTQAVLDARPERWRYALLREAELLREIPDREGASRCITGPAGTVLFMDPGRLHHRGRPPVAKDRTAIFHSYFPRRPRHPFCCERSPLTRAEIAAFAAPLPQRQRDAMLWRDTVCAPLRWIPPNRARD